MQYNENRYFPEDLDGDFHIRAMDKRYKYSSVESLEEFMRICDEYGLRYFAYYGTMLGAVRHKGFIPWDDDIDVVMFREDFNQFLKIAPNAVRPPFELQFVETSAFYPLRLVNGRDIRLEEDFLNRFHGCPYPTGIDIYTLDKLPEDEGEKEFLRSLYEVTKFMAQYTDEQYEELYEHEREGSPDDLKEIVDGIESALNVTFVRDNTLAKQLSTLCNRLAAIYNETDSKIVTRMDIWSTDGHREEMPIECFDDVIMMPFEEIEVPIPIGYDELLKRVYGDYMTPVRGGGAHQYRNYQEHEDLLIGELKSKGYNIPPFLLE